MIEGISIIFHAEDECVYESPVFECLLGTSVRAIFSFSVS